MNSNPQMASDGTGHEDAANCSLTAAQVDSFVINLCSSTTPMALMQPDAPELKRFRFFVSRRLEDRRERFRLHMGYFASLEEAEEWLSVVRDVYPGAWAGEAPGKRLRARAAAALPAATNLPHAESAVAVASPAVTRWEAPSASIVTRAADAAAFVMLPVLPPSAPAAVALAPPERIAASSVTPVAAAATPVPPAAAIMKAEIIAASMPPAVSSPAASSIASKHVADRAASATPLPVRPLEKPKAAGVAVTASAPAAPRAAAVEKSKDAAASIAASSARTSAMKPLSNVREVLASLDERDGKEAASSSVPQRRQALSDTQVMKILEERRPQERAGGAPADASSHVPMLRPDDTGTCRALKEAVRENAAVSFAVQLQWSALPMALDKVPPLAIFSAYTLYTVEGNREGRKWYGLRLGFFSDADAAKQVAQYVRSEFTSVAVLPVSPQERGRATEADQRTQITNFQASARPKDAEEIKLLDDEVAPLPQDLAAPLRGAAKLSTGGARTASPAARAAARSKKLRNKARTVERKAPQSLEETLEILGASALEIDNGRGEFINETGVRHISVEVRKNSPFARLMTRLTERVRKS
jgi:hypothetical protein